MKATDFLSAVAKADTKAYFTDSSFGKRTEMSTVIFPEDDLIILNIGPCTIFFNRMTASKKSYYVDLLDGERLVCTLYCDNIMPKTAEEESE